MKFMLDSNVIIAVALAAGEAVRRKMAEYEEGDFVISAVAYAEVMHGSVRGKPPVLVALQALIEEVPIVPFDVSAGNAYANLPFKRASYDHLIAAHALSRGLALVTDNQKHFVGIPGLRVENWMTR